jgi:fucose 4-O-acetylase-like acetyltransferase
MDNLRTFIIFLVVLYHAGGVYESTGGWAAFWLVDDPDTSDLVGIINAIINIFIMPVLFFISGYLTPISLDRKGGWGFVKARLRRLILPWAIAVLALIPLYKVIFLYARGLPQESWTTYFHFSPGNISSQNWLWFLPVLFLFNVVYLLLAKAGLSFPSFSRKAAVLLIMLIGFAYSLVVGLLFGPGNWTLTPLLDFENERLLLYFMIFLVGALYFRQDAFAEKPKDKALYITAAATAWIPITIYFFLLIIPLLAPNGVLVSPLLDRVLLWFSYYISLLLLMYLNIETFWRYLGGTGRIRSELNRNSLYVYLIHVVVIGLIALLLLGLGLPGLVKYVLLTVAAYVACNLLISLVRWAVDAIRTRV